MATLKEQMDADIAGVFYNTDDFAFAVTYTPRDETPGATFIIPQDADPTLSDPDILADMQTVRIPSAFFETYGIEPRRGDVLTWDGTTWTVVNKAGGGPHLGEWIIEITRSARRVIR